MTWSDIPWRPKTQILRQFSGLWLLFFAAVGWLYWWEHRPLLGGCLLGAALALGLAGLVYPTVMRPIFVGWLVVVFPIGWLVLHLALVVIYFGVMTPLAAWFRWRGRDLLQLRHDPEQTTLWAAKPMPTNIGQYYRMF
jgi:hypothetical protein